MKKFMVMCAMCLMALFVIGSVAMAAEKQATGVDCYKSGTSVNCPPAVQNTIQGFNPKEPVYFSTDANDHLEDTVKKYADPKVRAEVLAASQAKALSDGTYEYPGLVGTDFHPFQYGANGERKFAKIERFYNAKWVKKGDPARKGVCIRVD